MSAPVSVIIPTLNAATVIGPALAALAPGLRAGLIRELIVVDGGSSDDIAAIADELGAAFLRTGRGRGGQLAAGAAVAKGGWLLFLHADTVLSPDWAAAAATHLQTHSGKAGYFRLTFDAGGPAARLVAGWANLRSRLFGLPYGDQGLLVSRRLYDECGGYPDIPLMEDVAISRALRGRLRPLGATAVTSAARYLGQGWLRRGWRNLTTLGLYFLGRDPAWLAERYRR